MSIKAMKQALKALQGGTGNTRSWHLAIEDAIIALRTAIQKAEGKTDAPVGYMNAGQLHELQQGRAYYGYIYPQSGVGAYIALFTHPAPGVPEFSRIAKRKLDELQEQGFAITGYAIQRGTERGFITDGGFVGWWRSDEAPSVFLVRDVASLLRASVPDVCNALAELGYEPRRSTNAAISPDEAIAVAKRLNPAPGVPDGYALVPIKPTAEMMRAWNAATSEAAYLTFTERGYDAMLAASPAQKGGE